MGRLGFSFQAAGCIGIDESEEHCINNAAFSAVQSAHWP